MGVRLDIASTDGTMSHYCNFDSWCYRNREGVEVLIIKRNPTGLPRIEIPLKNVHAIHVSREPDENSSDLSNDSNDSDVSSDESSAPTGTSWERAVGITVD